MAYTAELTAKLTGASLAQLRRLRTTGVLYPEFSDGREILYSFRDVVALRSIMFLRSDFSLQKVRKVIDYLDRFDLAGEHLSEVRFAKSGASILVDGDDGFTDVLRKPGARELSGSLEDVFNSFKTFRGRSVPDFRAPSAHLRIDRAVMGGLPVIEGTRIPYDTIADLVDFRTIYPEDIPQYYSRVTVAQAADAVNFARSLRGEEAPA